MKTECTKEYSSFQALGRREIVTDFSGGNITSDGGGLLLLEVEQQAGIFQRFAQCRYKLDFIKYILNKYLFLINIVPH